MSNLPTRYSIFPLICNAHRKLCLIAALLQVTRQISEQIQYTVQGVAALNGVLYVIQALPETNRIKTYDCNSFQQLEDVIVDLEGHKKPGLSSITSCATNNCLYAMDSHNRCVLKVTIAGRNVTIWLEGNVEVI